MSTHIVSSLLPLLPPKVSTLRVYHICHHVIRIDFSILVEWIKDHVRMCVWIQCNENSSSLYGISECFGCCKRDKAKPGVIICGLDDFPWACEVRLRWSTHNKAERRQTDRENRHSHSPFDTMNRFPRPTKKLCPALSGNALIWAMHKRLAQSPAISYFTVEWIFRRKGKILWRGRGIISCQVIWKI